MFSFTIINYCNQWLIILNKQMVFYFVLLEHVFRALSKKGNRVGRYLGTLGQMAKHCESPSLYLEYYLRNKAKSHWKHVMCGSALLLDQDPSATLRMSVSLLVSLLAAVGQLRVH